MTTGPIEFLDDSGPPHEVPSTEMGGADGLIQPESDVSLKGDPEASGGHTLESDKRLALSEVHGILARRGMTPLVGREQSGVEEPGMFGDVEGTGAVIDPVTGRAVPESRNQESGGIGATGELSDLQP